jgi:hypothetical protein
MVNVQALAIVVIGCRFPGGAVDPESLWRVLCDGWHLGRFYHPDASVAGKTYARHGGFLDQSPYNFDAGFFGLSNREAAILDPQQRLLLEVTWDAFEDAGQDCLTLRGRRVGVFVGGFNLDNFVDRLSIHNRDHISPNTETSSTVAMLSNRLSRAFDFAGPSPSIDTACSSSLVATHLACASLYVVVTASPELYVAPWPASEGIETIGSQLEIDAEGRLAGRHNGPVCNGAEKLHRLRAVVGRGQLNLHANGESTGDAELLAAVRYAHWRTFPLQED